MVPHLVLVDLPLLIQVAVAVVLMPVEQVVRVVQVAAVVVTELLPQQPDPPELQIQVEAAAATAVSLIMEAPVL
jgi:hypothetical protein